MKCVHQEFTAYVEICLFVRERTPVFTDLSTLLPATGTTTALYKIDYARLIYSNCCSSKSMTFVKIKNVMTRMIKVQ